MGKGYYISKALANAATLLAITALVTIIALSVVYNREKSRNSARSGQAAAPTATPTPQPRLHPWDRHRLPDSLSPLAYNLTLWPRLLRDAAGLYVFTGSCGVTFTCVRSTSLILIHAHKLNLTLTWLAGLGGVAAPPIRRTWFQTDTQYMVVELDGELRPSQSYRLYTEFRGELADDLEGFYRSEYTEGGVKK